MVLIMIKAYMQKRAKAKYEKWWRIGYDEAAGHLLRKYKPYQISKKKLKHCDIKALLQGTDDAFLAWIKLVNGESK